MSELLSRHRLLFLFSAASGAAAGVLAARAEDDPAEDGEVRRHIGYLRPPGALEERAFLAACLRCGQCVQACPIGTLELAQLDAGLSCGAPFVTSRAVSCDLCAGHDSLLSIDACPTAALQPVVDYRAIEMGVAIIDRERCLSWQGTSCRACWHACPFPNEALTLDWKTRPSVVAEAGIGCGKRDHVCLTEPSSIYMLAQAAFAVGASTHVGEGQRPF